MSDKQYYTFKNVLNQMKQWHKNSLPTLPYTFVTILAFVDIVIWAAIGTQYGGKQGCWDFWSHNQVNNLNLSKELLLNVKYHSMLSIFQSLLHWLATIQVRLLVMGKKTSVKRHPINWNLGHNPIGQNPRWTKSHRSKSHKTKSPENQARLFLCQQ